MSQTEIPRELGDTRDETAWRPLFRLGASAAVVSLILIGLAIPAFFIWPPRYGDGASEVFAMLREDPFGGFMALDPGVPIGWLAMLPIMLAVYAAIRRVDRAWALVRLCSQDSREQPGHLARYSSVCPP